MGNRWSLRTRFVATAIACLIPLLLVLLYVLDQSLDNSRDQLLETETIIADIVAGGLNQALTENEEVLRNLAQTEAVQSMEPQATQELLGAAKPMRPSLPALFVIDKEGQLVASAGAVDAAEYMAALGEAAAMVLTTGEPETTAKIPISDAELEVIGLLVPVLPVDGEAGGGPVGVIGSLISVERLARVFVPVSAEAGQNNALAIVSATQIIASEGQAGTDPQESVAALTEPIEQAAAGQRVQTTYKDQNGDERLAVLVPVLYPFADWAVAVSSSSPLAYSANQDLLRNGLIGLTLAVLSALALSMFLGGRTARPLRRLAGQAGEIAAGDLEIVVEPAGATEVVAIGESVQEMSSQLTVKVRELETAQDETRGQARQLRELLRRTVRFQEDERRRIASDIHDAVSPLITGALYQTRAISLGSSNGNGHHQEVEDERQRDLATVSELLERSMDELHNVIFALRPPDLDDVGVEAAIERYVEQINRSGLPTQMEVIGEPRRISSEARLGIYRIVQESLHNSLRHAHADEAKVKIEWLDDRICVTIADDGSGFDPERASRGTSLGLASMRERASAIGATLQIVTRPGAGTAIVLERPLETELVPERTTGHSSEPDVSDGDGGDEDGSPGRDDGVNGAS